LGNFADMSASHQVFRKFNTKVWVTRNCLKDGVIQIVVVLGFVSHAELDNSKRLILTFLGTEMHAPRSVML